MSISLLALVLAALPVQSQLPSTRLSPITAPVRDAGILHVASGTWTRKSATASIGADVVYDNTCSSGYFSALSGDTYVDEGRLPSPTSPTNSSSRPGCATSYTIDGIQIGYCTDQIQRRSFALSFYESYGFCTSVLGSAPTATLALTGLPGSAGTAAPACWLVTIDLDAPPQTSSLAFVMEADGDRSYDGNEANNRFGWSFRSTDPQPQQLQTGPIIAGDPSTCGRFDGTRWDDVVDYAESGTGMGTEPGLYIEGGVTPPGCYFYHGFPFASLHLELYADACAGGFTLTFCHGDGTVTPCPCGNFGLPGEGCRNSLGVGGRLRAVGTSSISNDTFALVGDQMPANAPTLYFQGTIQQGAGQGTQFGDGLRCAGGTTIRLGIHANSVQGASVYPAPGDPPVSVRGLITVPSIRTYQAWYRNAANFCTSATFNLTNGVEIAWFP